MRSIVSSIRVVELAVSALSACALALAFPKYNLAWLAPFGAAGLFWTWQRLSWKRAFWYGWFAGTLFFLLSSGWFANTVGHLLGNFAFVFLLVPTMIEGLYIGAAAAFASLAFARASTTYAPLGAAAAFTFFEWLRSIGVMGAPFAQLGYSQAATPLAVFAAYAGTYGVTFLVCALGAYGAQAIVIRTNTRLLSATGAIFLAWCLCWYAWPARHAAIPSTRVVAVQGNISQDVKWSAKTLAIAVMRYTSLSRRAASFSPQLVAWPETVVTVPGLENDPALLARLGALARSMKTTLLAGSIDVHGGMYYNASFIYGPNGYLTGVYDKRQLVPFTEGFPGKQFLSWIPYSSLIADFGIGHADAVYDAAGLRFAPLICWESAFADLAHAQLRNGAQLLVVTTDDAWFGESSGPYQHAQIAQMRAIEGGTWVLRAASTGISGIIAPDGRYTERTDLDREAVVMGVVGAPPGSLFARIGPTPVILLLAFVYILSLRTGARRKPDDAQGA
ncbi:MAG: apolipoprotein N-acyltransferase [Candidatus Baltobacteraceae bacterium]